MGLSSTNVENVKQNRCTFYCFPPSPPPIFVSLLLGDKHFFFNNLEHCLFRHKIQIIYFYFYYHRKHSSTSPTLYSHEKLPYQEALENSTCSRNTLHLEFCAEGTPQFVSLSLPLTRGLLKGLLALVAPNKTRSCRCWIWGCWSWELVLPLRQ